MSISITLWPDVALAAALRGGSSITGRSTISTGRKHGSGAVGSLTVFKFGANFGSRNHLWIRSVFVASWARMSVHRSTPFPHPTRIVSSDPSWMNVGSTGGRTADGRIIAAYGINLSPLIARYSELSALKAQPILHRFSGRSAGGQHSGAGLQLSDLAIKAARPAPISTNGTGVERQAFSAPWLRPGCRSG